VVWLPFQKPLSLNDRQGYWAKAKSVKAWRDAAGLALMVEGIPACSRVRLGLHYFPKQDRRRDPDNLVASLKPCADALVDVGIVPDDTQEYVDRVWPFIMPKLPDDKGVGRFSLIVDRLA